jgi:hypothetical protein
VNLCSEESKRRWDETSSARQLCQLRELLKFPIDARACRKSQNGVKREGMVKTSSLNAEVEILLCCVFSFVSCCGGEEEEQ